MYHAAKGEETNVLLALWHFLTCTDVAEAQRFGAKTASLSLTSLLSLGYRDLDLLAAVIPGGDEWSGLLSCTHGACYREQILKKIRQVQV